MEGKSFPKNVDFFSCDLSILSPYRENFHKNCSEYSTGHAECSFDDPLKKIRTKYKKIQFFPEKIAKMFPWTRRMQFCQN